MLKRLLRIFRSFLNFFISKAENTELILSQMVEDMKGKLIEMRNNAVGVIAAEKQLMQNIEASQKKLTDLDSQIRLAVKVSKDDLASSLIAQKTSEEAMLADLKSQLGKAHQASEQAKQMIKEYELQIHKAMNERMQLVAANKRAAMQEQLAKTMQSFSVAGEFDTLEGMRQKIQERQAKAEAMLEIGSAQTEQQTALLQQSSDNIEVQAQLLEYKKQLGMLPPSPVEEPQTSPQKTMEPLKIEEKPPG